MSKTLTFTGHRPPRTGYGYDVYNEDWNNLKVKMKEYIVSNEFTDVWSGMALGTDTVAALATLELKQDGYPVRLHCAIPCHNYDDKWLPNSKQLFHDILSKADEVYYVVDGPYNQFCLSMRNFYMIDHADEIFAVWDRKPHGGTYEAITYATYKQLPIHLVELYKEGE